MRNISNETIKEYISEYGYHKDNIELITLGIIIFEDGRMGTTIHINEDTYIDFDEDVIYVKNDIIELQQEVKELGTFLYNEYEVIAKIEMCMYGGLIEDCVF
jgi:hypothetical protein